MMKTQEGLAAVSAAEIWIDRNVGADWLVVDLRAADDFHAGHIPGAVSAPLPEVADYELRLKVYAARRRIACVVPADGDGELAQRILISMGLGEVRVLEGGIEAWSGLGFSLETALEPRGGCEPRAPFLAGGLIVSGLLMGVLVSPAFLMMSGLGWAVCGARSVRGALPSPALALGG